MHYYYGIRSQKTHPYYGFGTRFWDPNSIIGVYMDPLGKQPETAKAEI